MRSRNAETGVMSCQSVLAHYSNHYPETVKVAIRDLEQGMTQQIISNKIHPFFVQVPAGAIVPPSSEGHNYQGVLANGHWVDASNLKPGYRLLNNDGSWAEVADVTIEDRPLQAYNMTIANDHTYFVRGAPSLSDQPIAANDNQAIWVHNDCINGKTRRPDGTEIDVEIDQHTLGHVLNGEVGVKGATGGHSTNSGSVKIIGDIETGYAGVRQAKVTINGNVKSINDGISTLFPESWSDKEIIGEFAKGLRTGITSRNPKSGLPRVVTPRGVTIEFAMKGNQIKTFYPVFQK